MGRLKLLIAVISIGVTLSACVSSVRAAPRPGGADTFGTRFMAYTLRTQLRQPDIFDSPIVVTTFADLNNLNQSSVFGRVIAEQLLDELHRAGFTVSEIRKGRDIFMKEALGEMILSRNARNVLSKSSARAVIAGTYVVTTKSVIINARLLDINSPLILSSSSYSLKMTEELKKLLTGEEPF
ncbi:hypothetical protein MNBD_NITROSPINAE02-816 [hydrothermal vent metagenome]|uniref:FlgO domain-containing protein n=1 Tax=hydrothermal vent metagenome TaxID=652676 RepID=A0A3B1CRU8_9ZZZZ